MILLCGDQAAGGGLWHVMAHMQRSAGDTVVLADIRKILELPEPSFISEIKKYDMVVMGGWPQEAAPVFLHWMAQRKVGVKVAVLWVSSLAQMAMRDMEARVLQHVVKMHQQGFVDSVLIPRGERDLHMALQPRVPIFEYDFCFSPELQFETYPPQNRIDAFPPNSPHGMVIGMQAADTTKSDIYQFLALSTYLGGVDHRMLIRCAPKRIPEVAAMVSAFSCRADVGPMPDHEGLCAELANLDFTIQTHSHDALDLVTMACLAYGVPTFVDKNYAARQGLYSLLGGLGLLYDRDDIGYVSAIAQKMLYWRVNPDKYLGIRETLISDIESWAKDKAEQFKEDIQYAAGALK